MVNIVSNGTSEKPKKNALCDWIQNVRHKKVVFKRLRGKDLRVLAVLTTSLWRAEDDLRIKQRERAAKWAQLRESMMDELHQEVDPVEKQKIDNLWESELNGLANFLSDLKQVKSHVVR